MVDGRTTVVLHLAITGQTLASDTIPPITRQGADQVHHHVVGDFHLLHARKLLGRSKRCLQLTCLQAWIGSSMTTIFVCDNHKAKYNQGICATQHEQKRAQFSLWFAYAVDVTSDLAVMFLPFRMTWSLQMARSKKVGVFVLFGSGWVCIVSVRRRGIRVDY